MTVSLTKNTSLSTTQRQRKYAVNKFISKFLALEELLSNYYNQQSTIISALRRFQNPKLYVVNMMGSLRNLLSRRMWSQIQSTSGCLQQYLDSASMHFTSSLEGEHQLDYNIQVDMSSFRKMEVIYNKHQQYSTVSITQAQSTTSNQKEKTQHSHTF